MQLELEAEHFAEDAGQCGQDDHLDGGVEVRVGAEARYFEGRFQFLHVVMEKEGV